MTAMPCHCCQFPRNRLSGDFDSNRAWVAIAPRVTIIFGRMAWICFRRNGRQAAISSASGFLLPGGRDLIGVGDVDFLTG